MIKIYLYIAIAVVLTIFTGCSSRQANPPMNNETLYHTVIGVYDAHGAYDLKGFVEKGLKLSSKQERYIRREYSAIFSDFGYRKAQVKINYHNYKKYEKEFRNNQKQSKQEAQKRKEVQKQKALKKENNTHLVNMKKYLSNNEYDGLKRYIIKYPQTQKFVTGKKLKLLLTGPVGLTVHDIKNKSEDGVNKDKIIFNIERAGKYKVFNNEEIELLEQMGLDFSIIRAMVERTEDIELREKYDRQERRARDEAYERQEREEELEEQRLNDEESRKMRERSQRQAEANRKSWNAIQSKLSSATKEVTDAYKYNNSLNKSYKKNTSNYSASNNSNYSSSNSSAQIQRDYEREQRAIKQRRIQEVEKLKREREREARKRKANEYSENAIESIAFIWPYHTSHSNKKYYKGSGPVQKTQDDTVDKLLYNIGCSNHRAEIPYTHNGKTGTVFFCNKPLSSYVDVASEIGYGTTYQKKWKCQKGWELGDNWKRKCKSN